jgi:hypothetical protein
MGIVQSPSPPGSGEPTGTPSAMCTSSGGSRRQLEARRLDAVAAGVVAGADDCAAWDDVAAPPISHPLSAAHAMTPAAGHQLRRRITLRPVRVGGWLRAAAIGRRQHSSGRQSGEACHLWGAGRRREREDGRGTGLRSAPMSFARRYEAHSGRCPEDCLSQAIASLVIAGVMAGCRRLAGRPGWRLAPVLGGRGSGWGSRNGPRSGSCGSGNLRPSWSPDCPARWCWG